MDTKMNTLKATKLIAAAITLSAVLTGPALAAVSKGELRNSYSHLIGADTRINTRIDGDTVTISGYYADAGDKNNIRRAILAHKEIKKVIDLAFTSS